LYNFVDEGSDDDADELFKGKKPAELDNDEDGEELPDLSINAQSTTKSNKKPKKLKMFQELILKESKKY
jgi:hypothetical protein